MSVLFILYTSRYYNFYISRLNYQLSVKIASNFDYNKHNLNNTITGLPTCTPHR